MAGEKNPEKIVADANVILSKNEKQELREFASKSPEKVKQEAIVSLETVYKIKEIIASRGKATLNREQIAVMQLYVNLKGKKIPIDGIDGILTNQALAALTNKAPSVINKPKAPTPISEAEIKTAVKKSGVEKEINKLDMKNVLKDSVDMSVAYLSHQQGSSGATEILSSVLSGEPVSSIRKSRMRGNIGDDFKEITGEQIKNLNAKNFFTYRYKKFNFNLKTQGNTKTVHDQIFAKVSKETGIPLDMLKAIVYTESRFDANSNKGNPGTQYKGLMQLGKDARTKYNVTDPYNAEANMRAGVKVIKENMSPRLVGLANNLKTQGIAKVLGPNAVSGKDQV